MSFRVLLYLLGIAGVLFLAALAGVGWYVSKLSEDLPDYKVLSEYEPPVMTRFHASDGQLIAEYARERRLYLPVQSIPELVKSAFISAEDKNFYTHSGLDYIGIVRAVVRNVQARGSGRAPVGASTITQQVAKNFLLTNERSIERKIKEAILAFRIERAYSKDKILELYLNQIFLGLGTYGVAAASLIYFDKSVNELSLPEAAYLAALPKGPNNYHPFRNAERAIERRNWVIDRMVDNGYVSEPEAEAAKAQGLVVQNRDAGPDTFAANYFVEDVRRQLSEMLGEDALYAGGLSVRTSLDTRMQRIAQKALINGLVGYDTGHGWRGPVAHIDASEDWAVKLAEVTPLSDVDWRLAVVLSLSEDQAEIGLRTDILPGTDRVGPERLTGSIPYDEMSWATSSGNPKNERAYDDPGDVLAVGDVVYVELVDGTEDRYTLRQIPEVGGALVAMDPHTGRVVAMAGGFSFAESQFNRATQAFRQPGSAFKPFVYAAALDSGYTPSSVIMDAPIAIDPGYGQPAWRPQNYSGKFYGPSTLRTGIEQSRNVMTVRLAQDMGMPLVAEYARRFGVYDDLEPYLPMSLGAGETTVLRMVAGYSVFANSGRSVSPTLIDRIQNRFGATIFAHQERVCVGCIADEWRHQEEPTLIDERDQVLDPMTAYQMVSILQGVVQRGTATAVSKAIDRPLAGKTGTTNDYRDAWFVGFSPNLVVGVYVGFDQPRRLGGGSTGGRLAAPIFVEFMQGALEGSGPLEFSVPAGMDLVLVNRKTGSPAASESANTIVEAFKPGLGPSARYEVIGQADELHQRSSAGRELPPGILRRSPGPQKSAPRDLPPGILPGSAGLY